MQGHARIIWMQQAMTVPEHHKAARMDLNIFMAHSWWTKATKAKHEKVRYERESQISERRTLNVFFAKSPEFLAMFIWPNCWHGGHGSWILLREQKERFNQEMDGNKKRKIMYWQMNQNRSVACSFLEKFLKFLNFQMNVHTAKKKLNIVWLQYLPPISIGKTCVAFRHLHTTFQNPSTVEFYCCANLATCNSNFYLFIHIWRCSAMEMKLYNHNNKTADDKWMSEGKKWHLSRRIKLTHTLAV